MGLEESQLKPKRTQIMTLQELAKYLGVHPITIYRLLKESNIPAVKIGGQWRFKKDVLDAWLLKEMNKKRKLNLRKD
ncbi:MAG: helix-turn-helix domain-containing protein [Candidatus Omnitrophica bacterium]|nr:helix-turn-helix domain-containing protein [Candidatus Omnitrophota bacterium]